MRDPQLGYDPASPPNSGPRKAAINKLNARLLEIARAKAEEPVEPHTDPGGPDGDPHAG